MRRFWIGVGILVGLLAVGLWAMWVMDDVHGSISENLRQASQAVQEFGWEKADALTDSAKADWEKYWSFSAAMADHTAMDEIDALLAQLDVYRQRENVTAYAAACARLAELIGALEEGHRLSWWNIL